VHNTLILTGIGETGQTLPAAAPSIAGSCAEDPRRGGRGAHGQNTQWPTSVPRPLAPMLTAACPCQHVR